MTLNCSNNNNTNKHKSAQPNIINRSNACNTDVADFRPRNRNQQPLSSSESTSSFSSAKKRSRPRAKKKNTSSMTNSLAANPNGKQGLIKQTLSVDYPGLDYLGFHNVLTAKNMWYRVTWFMLVTICLLIGLYTIYRIISEYVETPTATLISVKSVAQLLLPQLTVCATHAGTINLVRLEKHLFVDQVKNYTNEDVLNFAYFVLAGSGFQKMNWRKIDHEALNKLTMYYDRFRGERSIEEFFRYVGNLLDFLFLFSVDSLFFPNYFFMNTFGLQCHEFLQDCRLGDEVLDCCKVFEPEYLLRRGRCFRSIKLFQRSFDELGKLRVSLRKPFEMDPKLPTSQEVLVYLAEHRAQLAPFPRYYLYPRTWTKARVSVKHISLFRKNDGCSEENVAISRDTCYVQRWLQENLEQPHNCTFPFMRDVRNVSLYSCHPSIILDNYETTVEAPKYTTHSCILACDRWEYTIQLERTFVDVLYANGSFPYTFRIGKSFQEKNIFLDVSYNDLQYEELEEVTTVTFAGLIAQIGGQMSLFLGSSILNLIQVFIMIVILLRRSIFLNWRSRVSPNPKPSNSSNLEGNYNPAFKYPHDVEFNAEASTQAYHPTRLHPFQSTVMARDQKRTITNNMDQQRQPTITKMHKPPNAPTPPPHL